MQVNHVCETQLYSEWSNIYRVSLMFNRYRIQVPRQTISIKILQLDQCLVSHHLNVNVEKTHYVYIHVIKHLPLVSRLCFSIGKA